MGSRIVPALLVALACLHYVAFASIDGDLAASAKKYKSYKKRVATLCGPSSFTFYLHNTVYNPAVDNANNFTSVYGVQPNVTWTNTYSFGTTSTFEDPLTSGPATDSQQIGVAHGFWQLNSKVGYTLFHIFTANITEGDHMGTIDIFGQVREIDPVRCLTVIGGTGDCLGARGLAACCVVGINRIPPANWTLSFDLDLYY